MSDAPRYTLMTLADKDFKLVFNLNALFLLQEKFNIKLSDVFNPVETDPTATLFNAAHLLYCGLIDQHPDITPDFVLKNIDGHNAQYVMERLTEAFSRNFPTGEKTDSKNA